jgi:hypothetical protein
MLQVDGGFMKRNLVVAFITLIINNAAFGSNFVRSPCNDGFCYMGAHDGIGVDLYLFQATDKNLEPIPNVFNIQGTIYSKDENGRAKNCPLPQEGTTNPAENIYHTTNDPAANPISYQDCGAYRIYTYGEWVKNKNNTMTLKVVSSISKGWNNIDTMSGDVITIKSTESGKKMPTPNNLR